MCPSGYIFLMSPMHKEIVSRRSTEATGGDMGHEKLNPRIYGSYVCAYGRKAHSCVADPFPLQNLLHLVIFSDIAIATATIVVP